MKHNNITLEPYASRICGINPETGESFMIITQVLHIIDDKIGALHSEIISIDFTGSVPPINVREGLERMIRQVYTSKEIRDEINKEYRSIRSLT